MDTAWLDMFNEVVKRGDIVYHLGDFSFYKPEKTRQIVKKLPGQWHQLWGNHDRESADLEDAFAWAGHYKRIKVAKQAIILFHYPILSFHGTHKDAWHLHGHCVDQATEILTSDGWKLRTALSEGDSVVSYDHAARRVTMNPVDEIVDVNYTGNVYELSGKSVDLRVTADHTMIHFSRDGKRMYKDAAAQFFAQSRRTFLRAGVRDSHGLNLSNALIQLLVLIAADGTVVTETDLVRFRLWKERKLQFL